MNGDLSEKLDSLLSNPAMLAQIKALADTMTSGSEKGSPPPVKQEEPAPPEKESASPPAENEAATAANGLSSIFAGNPNLGKNIKNTRALLAALKPYLDGKRRDKIEKMLHMLSLAEMAGYFKDFI